MVCVVLWWGLLNHCRCSQSVNIEHFCDKKTYLHPLFPEPLLSVVPRTSDPAANTEL